MKSVPVSSDCTGLLSRPASGMCIEIIKYGIKQIKYAYRVSLRGTRLESQMGKVLSRGATYFPVAEKDDKMQMKGDKRDIFRGQMIARLVRT